MKIRESDIEQSVTEFLEWDEWRVFKMEMNFSERKAKRVGERGMPDRLAIRYACTLFKNSQQLSDDPVRLVADVLWLEFKAPGKAPRCTQLAWHDNERARGALVMVVDNIDGFLGWYRDHNLQRKVQRIAMPLGRKLA